jgi:hypothetical protein
MKRNEEEKERKSWVKDFEVEKDRMTETLRRGQDDDYEKGYKGN